MTCRWCAAAPAADVERVGPLCAACCARYLEARRKLTGTAAARITLLNPDYVGDDPAALRFSQLEVDDSDEE